MKIVLSVAAVALMGAMIAALLCWAGVPPATVFKTAGISLGIVVVIIIISLVIGFFTCELPPF